MNEIEIDGRIYVSTKRAAELTRYTKDYVGQLARGQKIAARLVGRNWYVDEQDILIHAGLIERDSNTISARQQSDEPVSAFEVQKEPQSTPHNNTDQRMHDGGEALSDLTQELDLRNDTATSFDIATESHQPPASLGGSEEVEILEQTRADNSEVEHVVHYESEAGDLFPHVESDGFAENHAPGQTLEEEVVALRREMVTREQMHHQYETNDLNSHKSNAVSVTERHTSDNLRADEVRDQKHSLFGMLSYNSVLIPGTGVVFLLCAFALALILYPDSLSTSSVYSRSTDEVVDQADSSSAAAAGPVFNKIYEYRRE